VSDERERGVGLWKAKARAAVDAIADPEDREHFESDFASL
jgi:hypothetical protein